MSSSVYDWNYGDDDISVLRIYLPGDIRVDTMGTFYKA